MLFSERFDHKARPLHIALYSHDTMGLGHTRRNLLIAQAITGAFPNANILMLTGASTSSRFAAPPRVDFLTLPALHKDTDGAYGARALDVSLKQLIKLRSRAIWAALKAFKPDALIVDNVPRGAAGELERTLRKLKKKGRTRLVLGLRDVLDDPKAVRKGWRKADNEGAIAEFYDEVWVYGDPRVYDLAREVGFSGSTAQKMRYLGFFDGRARLDVCAPELEGVPEGVDPRLGQMVLCQVGGGQDGAALALSFARARLPEGMYGVLVTGPYMPADVKEALGAASAENPRLKVLEFVAEPTRLLQHASRVVAMGGYNTTFEVLSYGRPLLIVPRVVPRLEQLVRAERLQKLGFLDLLHPDHLSPEALTDWLAREVRAPVQARERLDFGAMTRLPEALSELLAFCPVPLPTWEVRHVVA
jgi:predicted glycosyltransferase